MKETTVWDTLNPNHKNYIPYGGFRKAPKKFTSIFKYKGRKKQRENDRFFVCSCKAVNYDSRKHNSQFVFPSYPFMAIRDQPFRQVTRICWSCGKERINITLDEAKIKTGGK